MLKKLFLFALAIFGILAQDDISHPHGEDAMIRNLRNF